MNTPYVAPRAATQPDRFRPSEGTDAPGQLRPTPSKLLACFRAHTGEILSRDDLAALIWDRRLHPLSRCIDQLVAIVRKKLRLDERVLTVKSVGYMHERLTGHPLEET